MTGERTPGCTNELPAEANVPRGVCHQCLTGRGEDEPRKYDALTYDPLIPDAPNSRSKVEVDAPLQKCYRGPCTFFKLTIERSRGQMKAGEPEEMAKGLVYSRTFPSPHRHSEKRIMAKLLISKKSLNELQEVFVDMYVLRTIEQEFEAADIACNNSYNPRVGGERRTLVQQYYHTLDLSCSKDVRQLLSVFEAVLDFLEQEARGGFQKELAEKALTKLTTYLQRDGFKRVEGRLIRVGESAVLDKLHDVAVEIDAGYLRSQIDTMKDTLESNPALAIGTAKELVETICKTILHNRGVEHDEGLNLPQLVKETCKVLKLTRDDIPDTAKAVDTIRRLLSNLATVGQGLAELRNPYGSGHGRLATTKGLQPRHARLAVGAAATLATFLFETDQEIE